MQDFIRSTLTTAAVRTADAFIIASLLGQVVYNYATHFPSISLKHVKSSACGLWSTKLGRFYL